MWLTITILIIVIIYLISYNADLVSKLEEHTDIEKSKEAAWKLYERASSEILYLKTENKNLKSFKEATEHIIENYTIVEANDKIKELVQSCKETDTNPNN